MDWRMLVGVLLQAVLPMGLDLITKKVDEGDVPDVALPVLDSLIAFFAGQSDAALDPKLAELRGIIETLRAENRSPTTAEESVLTAYIEAQAAKAFGD